jgi:hypothetical protein
MPDPAQIRVEELLEVASEEGLLTEVVVAALREMKAHPDISVEEAMENGLYRWVHG